MDEEMEDFIVECMDVSEIDSDYEFDAARFFDFSRPESSSEAEEAESWFRTAGNYMPCPLIIKLNLEKEITAEDSHGCSRLQEGETTKSKSHNSYIPVGSEVSRSKSKIKGTISNSVMGHIIPKAKTKSEPKSSKARGSTLMNPTASHLAKQKCQKTPNNTDAQSSQNSLAFNNIATKRQKLESGYLRKAAHLKHQSLLSHKISKKGVISNLTRSKSNVTVPREPKPETSQRAQSRRSNNDAASSDLTKAKAHTIKPQSLNRKIIKAPPLPLRKTTAALPESHLSMCQNAGSAKQSASVDFKRLNTSNAVKQGKSVKLLKSKAHKFNKIYPSREDKGICENIGQESTNTMKFKPMLDEKLPVHPPIELFNKLSLRSEKETSVVSQLKRHPSAKDLKENAPYSLQPEIRKSVRRPNQCAAKSGIMYQSNMNRSLGIR